MTYCVGILLNDGIIFASDSRTHAGVDNFAKFCKMTVFERAGDRVLVLLSSGNLAGTQAVISVLKQRAEAGDGTPGLWSARTMFDVAGLVSDAMRDIERRDGAYLEQSDVGFNASFIVGGQIRDEPMRLFRIYAEGNFIEAGPIRLLLQTGETKYGKPIIDRVITPSHQPRGRDQVRAGLVRLDDAQQPVRRHADRPHLLRAGQPRDHDAPPVRPGRLLLHRSEQGMERRHARSVPAIARAAMVDAPASSFD